MTALCVALYVMTARGATLRSHLGDRVEESSVRAARVLRAYFARCPSQCRSLKSRQLTDVPGRQRLYGESGVAITGPADSLVEDEGGQQ